MKKEAKVKETGITVLQFFRQFPDDESCLTHLFNVRFGQGYRCPKCNREAKWYRIQAERAYSCQWCGNHLHPTVGTPFEDSRTSLRSWFYAIYLFTSCRHGVPAKDLERQLGITYKTAWRMGHEIRKHMAAVDGEIPLFGDVEADETYVGGYRAGKRGRGAAGKTIVFGMLQRGGQVMTKVVPNVAGKTLKPLIEGNVNQGSTVHTDELPSYNGLNAKGYTHKTVNHGAGEYVVGDCHVNGLESFWKHFKSSLRGTHIHISKKHLSKYAKEFEYRFNSRAHPSSMFPDLVSKFAKSLTSQPR
ncbi:MAG: IS1595 family transposase [Verrucomicrobia bacterium]|nr:IS1595 family transposase [Verrucomicrobiota bacterium]